jgi:hypothetical protein
MRGPWWVLIAAVVVGWLLFAALTVAGRGLALHAFGLPESCQVVRREEVDTSSRYPHYGFVHTLSGPRAGTCSTTLAGCSNRTSRAGTTSWWMCS